MGRGTTLCALHELFAMIGQTPPATAPAPASNEPPAPETPASQRTVPAEVGGRDGLDPTRYGDWEMNGRCIDF